MEDPQKIVPEGPYGQKLIYLEGANSWMRFLEILRSFLQIDDAQIETSPKDVIVKIECLGIVPRTVTQTKSLHRVLQCMVHPHVD